MLQSQCCWISTSCQEQEPYSTPSSPFTAPWRDSGIYIRESNEWITKAAKSQPHSDPLPYPLTRYTSISLLTVLQATVWLPCSPGGLNQLWLLNLNLESDIHPRQVYGLSSCQELLSISTPLYHIFISLGRICAVLTFSLQIPAFLPEQMTGNKNDCSTHKMVLKWEIKTCKVMLCKLYSIQFHRVHFEDWTWNKKLPIRTN